MSTLTKDQVRNLAPEQQEAFAALEIASIKQRQQLLDDVKSCHGKVWFGRGAGWIPTLLLFVWFGIYNAKLIPRIETYFPLVLVLIVEAFCSVRIQILNRRLNALVELLRADLESPRAGTSVKGSS